MVFPIARGICMLPENEHEEQPRSSSPQLDRQDRTSLEQVPVNDGPESAEILARKERMRAGVRAPKVSVGEPGLDGSRGLSRTRRRPSWVPQPDPSGRVAGAGADPGAPVAPLKIRAAAWSVDILICWFPALVLTWLVTQQQSDILLSMRAGQMVDLGQVEAYLRHYLSFVIKQMLWFQFFVAFLYLIMTSFCESSYLQATPGKRFLGLEARRADGGMMSMAHAALRFLSGTLSWLSGGIGHILPLFRRDRLSLSDLLTKTRVVDVAGGSAQVHSRRRWVPAAAFALLVIVPLVTSMMRGSDPVLASVIQNMQGVMSGPGL